MKKKIKLFAYKNDSQVVWFDKEIKTNITPMPDWDMEKETEVPDEVEKPREFWCRFDRYGHPTACGPWPLEKFHVDDEVIHVIEKLPDHVMVNRKQIEDAWNNNTLMSNDECLANFCKELGLKK